MFKLEYLTLDNFMSFKHAEIDFSKPGLYLIKGYNEIGGGSNGCGKSSIFAGVCYCLFGKTPTGLTHEGVRRWDSKEPVQVKGRFSSSSGTMYEITRRDGEVAFTSGGNAIKGHKRDIQEIINSTFRTSYSLFTRVNLFTQYSGEFLASMGDADKKQLFKMILGLEELDVVAERVKMAYDKLQKDYDTCNARIDLEKRVLEDCQHKFEMVQEKSNSYRQDMERNEKDLQYQLGIIKDRKYTDYSEDFKKLRIELKDTIDRASAAEKEEDRIHNLIRTLQDENAVSSAEMADDQEALEELLYKKEGFTCRHCGSLITAIAADNHKKELQEALAENAKCLHINYAKLMSFEKKLTELNSIKQDVDRLEHVIHQTELQMASHNSQKQADEEWTKKLQTDLKELRERPNPFLPLLKNLQDSIKRSEGEVEGLTKSLEDVSQKIDIHGFLKWVLSREGVSSYIIERAFGRLELLVNRFLGAISSERFQIEIRPQRELKSKALKEEIDIVVRKDERRIPYAGLSDGQRQRLNLATLLSIFLLCRDYSKTSFDFLLLDEVLDLSLDLKGQEDVIRLLYMIIQDVFHVFVISHKEEIAGSFGRQITVNRGQDGISKIV